MTDPFARPIADAPRPAEEPRSPKAFVPAAVELAETEPDFDAGPDEIEPASLPKGMGWLGRIAWSAGGLLVSLGLWLMADRLIADLFARYAWLGWAGVALLAAFCLAVLVVIIREFWAVRRLKTLDSLRHRAAEVLISDKRQGGQSIERELAALYAGRPDLARARQDLSAHAAEIFDGGEIVRFAERTLMSPLDARARALTAASARRVALVTAVSPRALVDVGFVIFESVRLAGAIAALYGARPGFFGFWRLTGAVLSHLAVTGGLVLTDGLVEQLVGQGLAARLSQRLGEGVVNGLMTVRVGIAAMRVVRPLPFETERQPQVRDFIPELVKVANAGR
ncbi:MAG TPA: TIGR01620 family protein [Devosiaceae bacterium]|nr:TIGR01620 family protein [Devosiaceae bacterium]